MKKVDYQRKTVITHRHDATIELTEGTLDELIQFVKKFKSLGFTSYNFAQEWGSCSLYFLKEELEDDDVYQRRIEKEEKEFEKEKKAKERKKEREYQKYLSLKKKFEPEEE